MKINVVAAVAAAALVLAVAGPVSADAGIRSEKV